MHHVDAVSVSGTEQQLVDLDDGALLAMARSGHQEAYAALFTRYSYAAHRLARHLGQKEDSDDVVSEAFAEVLDLLGRGKGPERAFRAYLFTTVRHECARRAKARKRVTPTDDLHQIDTPVAFGGGQLDAFERSAIRAAYESLPPRWQTVLWHLDVEGRKPHELGPLLDMSANSVSALVYRARAGLREAYLQQHVKADGPGDDQTCQEYRAKLSGFVRRTASARDQERIHAHLQSCRECMAIYLDLQEVNREVGVIAMPVAMAAVTGLSVASLGAQLAVLLKGAAAALALPAAAAAAVASVTGVGLTVHDNPIPRGLSAVQAVGKPASSEVRRASAAPTRPADPAAPRALPVVPVVVPAAVPNPAAPNLSVPTPAPDLGLRDAVRAAETLLGSVLAPTGLAGGGNIR
jgi:RNA polymerase sigma factor (sigma-70 family)